VELDAAYAAIRKRGNALVEVEGGETEEGETEYGFRSSRLCSTPFSIVVEGIFEEKVIERSRNDLAQDWKINGRNVFQAGQQ
jgi:hypothetical protein